MLRRSWRPHRPLRAALLAGLTMAAFTACDVPGARTDDEPVVDPDPDPEPDPDPDPDPSTACDDVAPVVALFGTRCAACHSGATFPDLRPEALPQLTETASLLRPDALLVVPGDLEASFLFAKMNNTQGDGGGALMPLGAATPIDEVAVVRAWIEAGAPTTCDDPLPTPEPPAYDPNSLDQDSLFVCDGQPERGSPARLRRLQKAEFTHAVGRTNSFAARQSQVANNPFEQAPGLPYTTFSDDVSIDDATLDLFLLQLPRVNANWSTRDPRDGFGERMERVYNNGALRCLFNDVTPADSCIDEYLSEFFAHGLLYRQPTDGEAARLKAFLVDALADEAGDASRRQETLYLVGQAAWLMTGALFRTELGSAEDATAEDRTLGRRPLADDELALALSQLLSTHPVGASLAGITPVDGDVDWETPEDGFFGAIARARDDGSIADPAVVDALLTARLTGVDATRPDLAFDGNSRTPRGEYFVAQRVRDFFREYLGYDDVGSVFKDTPAATSAFHGQYNGNPMFDPITVAYTNLQEGFHGREPVFLQQLDDTVARMIVEADGGGEDFFTAMLTGRTWRLPSNLAGTNGDTCTVNADCTTAGFTRCLTSVGLCGSSTASSQVNFNKIYGVGNVDNTSAARWVEMPGEDRGGLLTHPGWLSSHGAAFEDDASLVHRGKWIREHLFCETVPGLENVQVQAQLGPSAPDLTARERVRLATEVGPESTTCLGCHRLMNPLGNAFELYNHAGLKRVDDHGHPADGSTVLDNAPDPALNRAYDSPMDLSAALASSIHARRCFVRHTFRYFAGRFETEGDACTLTSMEQAFAGGSFTALLSAFAQSDAFRYRYDDVDPDTNGNENAGGQP